jgi:hypothetical protein
VHIDFISHVDTIGLPLVAKLDGKVYTKQCPSLHQSKLLELAMLQSYKVTGLCHDHWRGRGRISHMTNGWSNVRPDRGLPLCGLYKCKLPYVDIWHPKARTRIQKPAPLRQHYLVSYCLSITKAAPIPQTPWSKAPSPRCLRATCPTLLSSLCRSFWLTES